VRKILASIDARYDLVLYNAGTDPYPKISHEVLKERDELVFQTCLTEQIPCIFVLAGGYTFSQDMNSLVNSHLNTIKSANSFSSSNI
ncbi:MAG TPA: hypothetical protein QF850_02105, partial [Acidimicrobiales bacterium]|nr:hypothetical protein [Acidimicrobiales bacterium]